MRRVARRRAEQVRPESNHAASQRAKQQIESEGNQALERAIAKINESNRFDETLEAIFEGLPEPTLQISSNESYIQALATTAENVNVSPPREGMLGDAVAEIWIHAEPHAPIIQEVESLWSAAQPEIEMILKGFSDVQSRIDELVTQRRAGNWIVLEIASNSDKSVSL